MRSHSLQELNSSYFCRRHPHHYSQAILNMKWRTKPILCSTGMFVACCIAHDEQCCMKKNEVKQHTFVLLPDDNIA
jgi:hypothetical protein